MFSPTRFWTFDSLSVATSFMIQSLRQHHPHLNLVVSALLISEGMVVGAAWLTNQLTLPSLPRWIFAGIITALMALQWVHSRNAPEPGEKDQVVDVGDQARGDDGPPGLL